MKPFKYILASCLLLSVVGCNDDSNNKNSQLAVSLAPITEDGISLDAVYLESYSADAFAVVQVHGLPDTVSPMDFYVEYHVAGQGAPGPGVSGGGKTALIQAVEDEPVLLVVPLADPDGHMLKLRITNGRSYSDTFDFEQLPLPDTDPDITLEVLFDKMEAYLQQLTEAYQLQYPDDLQAFFAAPETAAPQYAPLLMIYNAFVNPDNSHGLRQQDFSDEERVLVERLLRHWRLLEHIEQHRQIAQGPDSLIPAASTAFTGHTGGRVYSASDDPLIAEGMTDINTPLELSMHMAQYGQVRRTQRDIDNVVDAATQGAMVIGIGASLLAGPAGVAGAGATVGYVKAALAGLSSIDALNGAASMVRGFFPCCIDELEMRLGPASGHVAQEDAVTPALQILDVQATVSSDGLDLTKELMDRVRSKLVGNISGDIKGLISQGFIDDKLIDTATASLFDGFDFSGRELVFQWQVEMTDNNAARWLQMDLDGFGAGPLIFKELPGYSPSTFSFDLDEGSYFGQEHQVNIVRVNPHPDEFDMGFWHPQMPYDSKPVSAGKIELIARPSVLQVSEKGEEIEFEIEVRNAVNGDIEDEVLLELEPERGSIALLSRSAEGSTHRHRYRYTAPAQELPDSFSLMVQSASKDGVRGRVDEPTPRFTQLRISTEPELIVINPGAACVKPGETEQFEAVDEITGQPIDVNWHMEGSGGSISSSGLFSAASAGDLLVLATSQRDSDNVAAVNVTVGDCSCWWYARVGGDFGESASGDTLYLDHDAGDITSINFSTDGAFFELKFPQAIPAGASGIHQAEAPLGSLSSSNFAWTNPEQLPGLVDPVPLLKFDVTRHQMLDADELGVADNSRLLDARASGTVVHDYLNQEEGKMERLSGPFSLRMRGAFWISLGSGRLNCSPGL